MDLEGLRSFVAISREKSISKAALSLHVTQPTLSARLRKLEESLDVKLLERSWEGVRLTIQGHYFLRYAIHLLQVFGDATTVLNLRNEQRFEHLEEANNLKRLTIGIDSLLTSSFIKPLVHELRLHYPELECKITTLGSTFMLDFIESGAIHIGIFFLNGEERPGIQSIPLFKDELILLYPDTYGVEIKEDLSNKFILKEKPFLLFDDPVLVNFRDVTKEIFHRLFGEMPSRFHIVDDINVTMEIVAKGYGYTVVTGAGVAHLLDQYPSVRFVRLGSSFPKLAIHLAYTDFQSAPIPLKPLLDKLSSIFKQTIPT